MSTVNSETKEAIAVPDGVIIQGYGLQVSGSQRKVGERYVATFNPNKPTTLKATDEQFTAIPPTDTIVKRTAFVLTDNRQAI